MPTVLKGPAAPKIMGVINATPDSFSDGGRFLDADAAIKYALRLANEGADILDIGGESTRPGAVTVSIEEECARVLPIIEGLQHFQAKWEPVRVKEMRPGKTQERFLNSDKIGTGRTGKADALISIDTLKAEVAKRAVAAGATIWNDVTALTYSPDSINVAASLGCNVVLMHAQGDPKTMQNDPHYDDVVDEVYRFLADRIEACVKAGIDQAKLIVDPGIGFGKKLDHNLALIANLKRFTALGCPILLGASRKRFIAALDREGPADDRLGGSIAAVLAGYNRGAVIFRVHDVAETRQALNVAFAIETAMEKPPL